MEKEKRLRDLEEEVRLKRRLLQKAESAYLKAKRNYELVKYNGLSKRDYEARKRKELEDQKIKHLYEVSKKYEKENKENATESEKKLRAKLQFNKIKYEFQKTFMGDNDWWIADFYLPEYNMIIELDGGYHTLENQKVKDRKKNKYFKKLGYIVCRLKNEKADKISADELKGFLIKYFNKNSNGKKQK